MTRSRAARCFRALLVCLPLGALAACGTAGQWPATQGSAHGDWQRPDGYDPPGPAGDPWAPYIAQASRRFDVPERWIREVMRQESGGRQAATSRAGAMGLMQVMPGTYAELTRRYGLGGDPYHPWDNIMAGTAYIREMYELYGAPGFLAAYNAGPRRLEDYLWAGRGLPNETRNYVARIGPRIAGTHPNRRAAPEVYAAAELPLDIPAGPRRGDTATMLALREQRNAVDPGIRLAQLPPGPVVRMDPIPDGSTTPAPAPVQLASAGPITGITLPPPAGTASVLAAAPVVRMAPITSPGDPGTLAVAPPAPSPAARPAPPMALAAAAPRGFSLIPQAQAGTLALPPRPPVPNAAPAGGGAWGVQVGAFASANLANAAAGQARDLIAVMGTRTVVEPVQQGRATLYRARVVGLGSRGSADQACERLRSRGGCMIVAPGA